MQRLHGYEAEYVKNLKKRDRSKLASLLVEPPQKVHVPLRIQVLQSQLPEEKRVELFEELRGCSSEKYVQWVRRAVTLPLQTIHQGWVTARGMSPEQHIARARTTMDSLVTGYERPKFEVLKMVAQCGSAYSLGLEGPPGVGKTHFVRTALSEALGRPFVSIPLGGASDAAFLLGNLYTYEGSKEGRLASALIESKCCNPILYFDEVDKVPATERGQEIVAALIHLIDPSCNTHLRDRYFHGIDLDFSKCTFVFSYNDPSRVSPVLLDRIRRIAVPSPTPEERYDIFKQHLLPRVQERIGTSLTLSDSAVELLLARSKGGMRGVEKDLEDVLGAAQLAKMCGQVDKCLDDHCSVVASFARAHLGPMEMESTAPPGMMYT